MTIELFHYTVEVAGLTCLTLLLIGMVRQGTLDFSTRVLLLLVISGMCFFLRTRQEYQYWIPDSLRLASGWYDMPLDIGMNAFSGLFAIFAFSLFQDYRQIPRWFLALFGLQLALEPFSHFYIYEWAGPMDFTQWDHVLFMYTPRILQIMFVLSTIYWIVAGWQADLLERRRLLRWVFLGYQASTNIFASVMYVWVIPQDQTIAYHFHVSMLTLNTAFLFALVALSYRPDISLLTQPSAAKQETTPLRPEKADDFEGDWRVFESKFLGEHLYRKAGLNIASLAAELGIPEYRLRRLINEKLGYRNFNALLHEHRLREATDALGDPSKADLPVLTIALEAGYQSINPFNRAFRDLHGMTPTAYRQAALNGKNL